MRLADDVAYTPLPYGGAVLINGRSLAVVELAEADASALERLLHGEPAGLDARQRHLVGLLVAEGWLVDADGEPAVHPGDAAHGPQTRSPVTTHHRSGEEVRR